MRKPSTDLERPFRVHGFSAAHQEDVIGSHSTSNLIERKKLYEWFCVGQVSLSVRAHPPTCTRAHMHMHAHAHARAHTQTRLSKWDKGAFVIWPSPHLAKLKASSVVLTGLGTYSRDQHAGSFAQKPPEGTQEVRRKLAAPRAPRHLPRKPDAAAHAAPSPASLRPLLTS